MAGFNTCTYVGPFNTPVELDDVTVIEVAVGVI